MLVDRHGQPLSTLDQAKARALAATGAERDGFESVIASLERSGEIAGPFEPRASIQSWRETLYSIIADGAQVLNTTTETIMVPDFSIPANYMYQGRTLKYTLFFDQSFVITTPGTSTLRLRWGGVAGTVLAASGAFAPDPTAAQTTRSGCVEWYVVCRSIGTAGSMFTMGRMWLNDYDDASATSLQGNLNMTVAPTNAPAVVSSLDTTTAKALSPTVAHSVATATTQTTCHLAVLEALN